MEQAGLSVENGPRDLLDHDFQLDLDSTTEAEQDGLDFGLDIKYDEVEHLRSGTNAVDAAAFSLDPKIGSGLENTETETAANEEPQTTEAAHNTGGDAELEVEYKDEIGYEDDEDDLVATDVNADLGSTEPLGAGTELSSGLSEGHPEPTEVVGETHSEELAHEKDASMHQELESEEHSEAVNPPDEPENADGDEQVVANLGRDDDLAINDFNDEMVDEMVDEQYATDQHQEPREGLSDLDQAIEDLAHSLAEVPDIEVIYNEECYSLIGTPDDDPNSYFLSDANELDQPLSQFLSALRAVISNEMAPTDQLMVRFDPLDLQFGERSNEKFLSRSFREILDCHAALAAKEAGIPPDPVIHLVVQRDSEEHFLELLAEADLDDGQSHRAEDSETPENLEGEPEANDLDVELVQDEQPEDGYSEEYDGNVEDASNSSTHEHAAASPDEGKNDELETASDQDDVGGEQDHTARTNTRSPQSPELLTEDFHGEESFQDDTAETHPHGQPEDVVNDEQDWAELGEESGATASPPARTPPDTPSHQAHEGVTHQDDNEFGETAEFGATDNTSPPEGGETEQGTGSNGKYSFSLSPTHNASGRYKPQFMPAAVPLSQEDGSESPLIDYSDDGEPTSAVSASEAGQKTLQAARQAPGPAPTTEEDESWEIDYSDDESEPTPGLTPTSQGGPSEDSVGHVPDGELVLEPRLLCSSQMQVPSSSRFRPVSIISRASSTLSLSKISEASDASMAFSFAVDANTPPHQDDDLILTFDDEPGLSTIGEEVDEYEELTITYDDTENAAEDVEGVQERHVSEDAGDLVSNELPNGASVVTAADTASVHTSTTVGGDEIDYDEQDDAGNPSTPGGENIQHSATASGDEIDWENDEDEEQQPSNADGNAEFDEPNEVTQTPSSNGIAGKRSRTDEVESLAEETDHKRRRT